MNDWQSIIGHKDSIGYLQHVLANRTVPSCMVFSGPQHVGKRSVADVFISDMKQQFPISEIHHIDSWDEEQKSYKQIGIEEIRESISGSLYTKHAQAWNVTVIDGADYLTEQASNALLKVMEEPGARVVFILIAHRIQRMLPTILSRACVVRFRLVPQAVLKEGLKKRGVNLPDNRLTHATGLPGLALRGEGELSQFDVRFFTSPVYKQLEVASQLTGQDFTSIEIALEQMAHSPDAPTKAEFLSYTKRYMAVHTANSIGSLSNAFEHLFL